MKKFFSLFILSFVIVLSASAQDISSALRQAEARFSSGNETGAIELVTKVLQKYPDNQEAKALLEKFNKTIADREIDADWQTAQSTNTFEAYEQFRTKHPGSKYDDTASDNMAKRLADKFTPNSSYSDRTRAESYAKKGMTKDYIANKWKAAMAKKTSSSSASPSSSYRSSNTTSSSSSYNSSYSSNRSYSSYSNHGSATGYRTTSTKPRVFSVGINGYLEGLSSFSTGVGLQMRIGRISSPINFVTGVKYQYTYCKELVSYLDFNDDYYHIDDYIKSGMAYYVQNISQFVVPIVLNWNFIASDKYCGFFGFGYEHGFLLSKNDGYKKTSYGDDFNMNDYLMSEDYPDHTILAYPSRSIVIKGGMGAEHWDWSVYGKIFLNRESHNETASLGFEFTYYF